LYFGDHFGFIEIFKMAAVSMETVNICQNRLPHLYRKLPKGFFKITLDINFN
jgi:hypothetical protein